MNFDRTAVWFGMSETGRPSRRYLPARLTGVSDVLGRTTFTGSECHGTANQAIGARVGQRNAQPKRRRSSVMAIAFLAVLLPFGAVAGSTPFVWPGGTTITVRDYTSDTFDGIVQKEVAAWSEIMPGGTSLRYVDAGFKDCNEIGGLKTNSVADGGSGSARPPKLGTRTTGAPEWRTRSIASLSAATPRLRRTDRGRSLSNTASSVTNSVTHSAYLI